MSTDVDARLREYATRWRAAQADETSDAIVERVSTPLPIQHRRRAALAVAASIAAVGAIAAATLVFTHQHERSSVGISSPQHSNVPVVPWSSAGVRADTTAISPSAKIAAADGLRRCVDTDFSLVSSKTHSAASDDGRLTTSFVLHSVASTTCAISNGSVIVVLVTSAGVELPHDLMPQGPGPAHPRTLAVAPGQLVSGNATWAVYEERAPRPTQLVINISGQSNRIGDLSVPLDSVTIPPHPRYLPNPWRSTAYGFVEAVTTPGTLASLTATVTAPTNVTNGDVLRYAITLTNRTATAVTFPGCPDFVERLDVVPVKVATTVGFRGPLNCARAPKTVEAGHAVRFHYELPTTGETPGQGRLTWQLLAGDTAAVTATAGVTVQP